MFDITLGSPRLSATVVLLREGDEGGIEVLLLERKLRDGSGGHWVFPGGLAEPQDQSHLEETKVNVSRRAAVRETFEEAGVELRDESLTWFSRWITPAVRDKRYDTHFYASELERSVLVQVDGVEIRAHAWFSPPAAIQKCNLGQIQLVPPTFVTLHWLLGHSTRRSAISALVHQPTKEFRPNICLLEGNICALYPGDAGFEASDPLLPGSRHRVQGLGKEMEYLRSTVDE
jgi:8-oxo-dGTP pyrophosphatase MutT (NUDIX family)